MISISIAICIAVVIPFVVYLSGYFWTKGIIAAKRDAAQKAYKLLIECERRGL
jgi:hypothetical protein